MSGSAPAYPGRQFREGDSSEALKAWQKQMGTRGYDLVGTGYFGPKTKAAVLDLQAKAGLNVVGYIGPKTWAAAWNGWLLRPRRRRRRHLRSRLMSRRPTSPAASVSRPRRPGPASSSCRATPTVTCSASNGNWAAAATGLTGTGYYGPATKTAVVELQQRNGINPSGILGPLTWAAAWEGS